MKFKTLLLCAAASAAALSGAAQSHHGYYKLVTMDDIEAFLDNDASSDELNCWFTPECVMPVPNENGTLPASTIYNNNSGDMLVRPNTMNDTYGDPAKDKNKYYEKLVGSAINDQVTESNFAKGYLEVTVPSRMDYPRTDGATPNWVDVTTTNNAMVFHICLPGEPQRINDKNNTLSATDEECYLSDCNGCYVGVKAPAGATVKAYLHTSTLSASNMKKDTSGSPYNPNLEGKVHTMAFDFDATFDGNYKEIKSGEPYGALAGKTYVSTKWPNGYCVKYLDVVIYGVNPGDKVGFGGIQTLHDGWTPKEFVPGWAGVETIGVDTNANAPVEYFNIQGMRVAADNLTPGLYIKRQGTETAKVIVK